MCACGEELELAHRPLRCRAPQALDRGNPRPREPKLSDNQAIAGAVLGSQGTSTNDNFVCAACGLTPGRQTIDRSGLAAICSIVLSVAISAVALPVHVVSDSKYALHALSLVSERFENGTGPLRKMQNQDLLWILLRYWRPGYITWEKVKSHQHVNDAKCARDLWLIIGNDMANRLAASSLVFDSALTRDVSNSILKECSALCTDYQRSLTSIESPCQK